MKGLIITKRTKKTNNFSDWINTKILPTMGKVGNQKHLSAIRDGFSLLIPLIIASAVGIIIRTMIFGGAGAGEASLLGLFQKWAGGTVSPPNAPTGAIPFGAGASQFSSMAFAKVSYIFNFIFYSLEASGIGTIGLLFAFSFGYFLAKAKQDEHPIMGGMVSIAAFLIVTKSSAIGETSFYGGSGILVAIVFGIISVELYCKFAKSQKLKLSMPEGVPPAVARSFEKLFPVMFSLLAIVGIYALVAVPTFFAETPILSVGNKAGKIVVDWKPPASGFWTPADLVFSGLQAPLVAVATIEGANLGIAILYVFVIGFLWFFGVHGSNVANGVFQALWTILLTRNIANIGNPGAQSIFVQGTFDAFIFFGGTMVTLGLIIANKVFSKRADEKAIIDFATPAGVFNINEPIIFGLPIVANPLYIVPTFIIMPALTVMTWAGFKLFGTTNVALWIPWTSPMGIGALLATNFDYTAFIIAAINLIVAILIWTPFVMLSNSYAKKQKMLSKDSKVEVKVEKPVASSPKPMMKKFNLSKFLLIILPTAFLGFFLVSISLTFGDNLAGKVLGSMEGFGIFIGGFIVFFWSNIKVLFKK